jgi:hypothetical protein
MRRNFCLRASSALVWFDIANLLIWIGLPAGNVLAIQSNRFYRQAEGVKVASYPQKVASWAKFRQKVVRATIEPWFGLR